MRQRVLTEIAVLEKMYESYKKLWASAGAKAEVREPALSAALRRSINLNIELLKELDEETEEGSWRCDECGESVPDDSGFISSSHAEWCTGHPTALKNGKKE